MNLPLVMHYLQLWDEIVMHSHGDIAKLGFPKRSLGISTGGLNNFDDMYDNDEQRIAHAMDGVIDSLPEEYKAAVLYCFRHQRVLKDGWTTLVQFEDKNTLRPTDEVCLRIWFGMLDRDIVA